MPQCASIVDPLHTLVRIQLPLRRWLLIHRTHIGVDADPRYEHPGRPGNPRRPLPGPSVSSTALCFTYSFQLCGLRSAPTTLTECIARPVARPIAHPVLRMVPATGNGAEWKPIQVTVELDCVREPARVAGVIHRVRELLVVS
jgi:hypothetical protein